MQLQKYFTDPIISGESEAEKKYWIDSKIEEDSILRVKMKIIR